MPGGTSCGIHQESQVTVKVLARHYQLPFPYYQGSGPSYLIRKNIWDFPHLPARPGRPPGCPTCALLLHPGDTSFLKIFATALFLGWATRLEPFPQPGPLPMVPTQLWRPAAPTQRCMAPTGHVSPQYTPISPLWCGAPGRGATGRPCPHRHKLRFWTTWLAGTMAAETG